MLLSEAGADFLQYCAAECGHTPNTIKAYRQAIRRFREWLLGCSSLDEVGATGGSPV